MNDKGGVLGRKLELILHDNGSDPATAVRLYDKLITPDKRDLFRLAQRARSLSRWCLPAPPTHMVGR